MMRGVVVVLVAAFVPVAPQDKASVLTKKWEYKIMERVYLAEPSGWINHMPWLISSPAIGDIGNGSQDLEVVTGTEEGFGEWFPRGQNSGRYVCVSSKGAKLWDYETKNNAGRASPGMADIDGDGVLECTGGSTSGWMVHCFDKDGSKKWRFECKNQANVLSPPATADLTSDAGLETIAVALDGNVYCVSAAGKEIWNTYPGGEGRGGSSGAAPAIADLDGDGKPEVVVSLLKTYCLDGVTGRVKWATEAAATMGGISSPAILPKADPCWRQAHLGREAGQTRVYAATGKRLESLNGATGKLEWHYESRTTVVSSPAIGDVDGDATPDIVLGDGQDVVCLNAYSGKVKWRCATGANVYSSPALGHRNRHEAHRRDWPMYRHDAQRTGFYGFATGPLGIYVGSDDGYLHVIDGRNGERIDRYAIKFPDLNITGRNYGALKFLSSPSLADLDGNGTLEAVFTLVDRVWAIEDIASALPQKSEAKPVSGKLETVKKNGASPRNAFALAQVIHPGGWNPGVPVPGKMLEELTRRAKLDVMPEMTPLSLRDDDVTRFPFLYMTGHDEATLTDEERRTLKGHLERGGFLFAEACCNSAAFEKSIRLLASKLYGDGKLVRIPMSHPIWSKVYAIKTVSNKGVAVEPEFDGVELNGRLVFLFTKQDYGCSWGNSCCTSGCSGIVQEDSYRVMTNIAVYALTE